MDYLPNKNQFNSCRLFRASFDYYCLIWSEGKETEKGNDEKRKGTVWNSAKIICRWNHHNYYSTVLYPFHLIISMNSDLVVVMLKTHFSCKTARNISNWTPALSVNFSRLSSPTDISPLLFSIVFVFCVLQCSKFISIDCERVRSIHSEWQRVCIIKLKVVA